MTTPLERAIESLTDPSVQIADALRGLMVVSRRIGADDLSTWVRSELDGYGNAEVPVYRRGGTLPIVVRFDGMMGRRDSMRLQQADLHEKLHLPPAFTNLRQPVAELAQLCQGDEDPMWQMPLWWLVQYRALVERGEAPHWEYMEPNHAAMVIPRTFLLGVVDRVKSFALDLALKIEDVSVDAGVAGGPTLESEPRLAAVVNVQLNQVFATNSTVAVGDNASATQVQVGDVDGLLSAARSLLTEEGIEALKDAIEQDGGEPAEQTRSFLDRVRGGAYVLGGSVATSAVYDALVGMLGGTFPGFGG